MGATPDTLHLPWYPHPSLSVHTCTSRHPPKVDTTPPYLAIRVNHNGTPPTSLLARKGEAHPTSTPAAVTARPSCSHTRDSPHLSAQLRSCSQASASQKVARPCHQLVHSCHRLVSSRVHTAHTGDTQLEHLVLVTRENSVLASQDTFYVRPLSSRP